MCSGVPPTLNVNFERNFIQFATLYITLLVLASDLFRNPFFRDLVYILPHIDIDIDIDILLLFAYLSLLGLQHQSFCACA